MSNTLTRRTVRWIAFWLLVQGVIISINMWIGWHNDIEHRALVREEELEEELEEAVTCANAHQRYDQFVVLAEQLTEAGALVGTDAHLAIQGADAAEVNRAHEQIRVLMPARISGILDLYPPPECDRAAALEVIAK